MSASPQPWQTWNADIICYGNKSLYRAEELYGAEQAAYKAYTERVEEMKYSGSGVIPHDGNNQKMQIYAVITELARGSLEGFNSELAHYRQSAGTDPVHYSPMSHALSAAEGFLSTLRLVAESSPAHPPDGERKRHTRRRSGVRAEHAPAGTAPPRRVTHRVI